MKRSSGVPCAEALKSHTIFFLLAFFFCGGRERTSAETEQKWGERRSRSPGSWTSETDMWVTLPLVSPFSSHSRCMHFTPRSLLPNLYIETVHKNRQGMAVKDLRGLTHTNRLHVFVVARREKGRECGILRVFFFTQLCVFKKQLKK